MEAIATKLHSIFRKATILCSGDSITVRHKVSQMYVCMHPILGRYIDTSLDVLESVIESADEVDLVFSSRGGIGFDMVFKFNGADMDMKIISPSDTRLAKWDFPLDEPKPQGGVTNITAAMSMDEQRKYLQPVFDKLLAILESHVEPVSIDYKKRLNTMVRNIPNSMGFLFANEIDEDYIEDFGDGGGIQFVYSPSQLSPPYKRVFLIGDDKDKFQALIHNADECAFEITMSETPIITIDFGVF